MITSALVLVIIQSYHNAILTKKEINQQEIINKLIIQRLNENTDTISSIHREKVGVIDVTVFPL